jgi:branched-chain amino acid transport system substrate-binding protein
MLAGFERYYKGKVAGRILYKTGQTDFQADITRIRAANPPAVFTFSPGGMGIAFLKQWAASGVGKDVKLYSVFTVDYATLPAIGDAAIGTYHTSFWSPDSKDPVNQRFVKDYRAKYGAMPPQYAAQSYDAARLIAAAVRNLDGKIDEADMLPLVRAMRKVPFPSIRGDFKYNVNGVPIQNFYKREVVKGDDGKPMIRTAGTVFEKHKDSYWEKCPQNRRH